MARLSLPILSLLIFTATGSLALAVETVEGRFQIEVVTVDAGAELFARWGHISIIVTDKIQKTSKTYDFGTYNFDNPVLRLQYIRGFLNYRLSIVPYEQSVRRFISQNRGVISRTLNLTPEQAATVAKRLKTNALPENRTYAYRHYLDNCCTRIRDLINDVLGGSLKKEFDTAPTGRSYRFYTTRALKGLPVTRNIILFLLGRETDKPVTRWDEQFVPEVFGSDIDKARIAPDDRLLVAQKRVLHEQGGPRPGEKAAGWEIGIAAFTLALLIFGFGTHLALHKKGRKWTRRAAGIGIFLWGLLGGVGGLLLLLLWTGTTHYDSHNNENILVFPFTHLWLLGPGLVLIFKGTLSPKVQRLLQRYLTGCLILLGISLLLKLGPFFQENYQFIAFAAVLNLSSLLLLRSFAKDPDAGKQAGIRKRSQNASFID